jgi:glutamine amidotransferase-like uncharacterized protein
MDDSISDAEPIEILVVFHMGEYFFLHCNQDANLTLLRYDEFEDTPGNAVVLKDVDGIDAMLTNPEIKYKPFMRKLKANPGVETVIDLVKQQL